MDFRDKQVLITGGGSGIGRHLAQSLAAAGAHVLICGRRGEPLAQTARDTDGAVEALVADIATEAGRQVLVSAVAARGRPLDLLVHNAGIQQELDLRATGADDLAARIQQGIDVNLTAPLCLTALLRDVLREPGATIVHVTSLLALHPKAAAPVYCATKSGLRAFTRALRHQLRTVGIRVVEVVPPLVDTQMTAGRGRGKIGADEAAAQIVAGLERDRKEILIGKAAIVCHLNRVAPGVVARILMKA